jgi:hypothetical protein
MLQLDELVRFLSAHASPKLPGANIPESCHLIRVSDQHALGTKRDADDGSFRARHDVQTA